jgi:Domain of unknown function (DUF5667)
VDAQHLDYDDESLVRAALQAAYPSERPVFSQRRGAQIIRAAAVEALEQPVRRRPFVGSRVAACLAATFTLLAGTAGVAGAALPGQPLYPIKRVVERAMVAIAGDGTEAARLELRFAERRLVEAEAVADEADGDLSTSISDRFDAHLNAATSLAGDEVAGEVEHLERSRRRTTDGNGSQTDPAAATPPAATEPEVPELSADPVPVSTETPSPSTSPSPSVEPANPAPMADPSPIPSPSPSAREGEDALIPPDLQSLLGPHPTGDTPTRAD